MTKVGFGLVQFVGISSLSATGFGQCKQTEIGFFYCNSYWSHINHWSIIWLVNITNQMIKCTCGINSHCSEIWGCPFISQFSICNRWAPLYQVWKISMSKPPNFETPTPGLKVCRSQDLKVEARGSGRSKSSHLPSNVAHVRPTAISHVGPAFPVKCRSLPIAIWILDILLHISL